MSARTRNWHVVTCEYPPAVGGVADYTAAVARELRSGGDEVHVWAPGSDGDVPSGDGIRVHRTLGRFSIADCIRTGREMNTFAGRRLFVQWVPHGYGYKSLNVPFACWLAWRVIGRRDEMHLMVHEPYMRVSWPPSHLIASLVERMMLSIVGMASSRVWLSTPSWHPFVAPYVRRRAAIEWLPVPAPVEYTAPSAEPSRTSGAVIGHFSTHSPVVTSILRPVLEQILAVESAAEVILIGRDSERFRHQLVAANPSVAARVTALGVRPMTEIVKAMAGCDVMVQPFPDGITTRNTSMLLALSAGRCVVSNSGALTEPVWASAADAVALARGVDPTAIARLAVELLRDRPRRERMAECSRRLYRERFSAARGAAMLSAAVRADSAGSAVSSHVQA